MSYIKNRATLLSHGNVNLRRDTLDIIDHALLMSDPYFQVKKLVSLQGNRLKVGQLEYNLDQYGRIFVLGAGKATYPIAKALEEILGGKIESGVIICKYGQEGTLSFCELHFANHPIPDEAGVTASQSMMDIAQNTQPKDIVFCCITGGSTSLMPLHVDTISLDDLKQTYKLLLRSGANIIEMNAVRKHLSRIKGGWLAKNIHPEAELINLTVSDVIGDPLDYITCPTVPDTSTFDDARATLTKYNLWEKLPKSVCTYLKKAGQDQETPKKLSDHKIHNFIIVKGDEACVAAMTKAQELGYNSMILTTMLEGESKEAGSTFAAIAKEIVENNRPLKKPCVVISGGETTIRITGKAGEGGPNQQFALSAATWIEGLNNVVIASIDTDGTDGVSTLAGGIVDGKTMEKARLKGIDLQKHINEFDDTPALQALGDGIFTGATGTNVNDLQLMLVR